MRPNRARLHAEPLRHVVSDGPLDRYLSAVRPAEVLAAQVRRDGGRLSDVVSTSSAVAAGADDDVAVGREN